ncbi:MAG TPA: hypothetical protein VF212_12880 [Longimicrobiales bacterium]
MSRQVSMKKVLLGIAVAGLGLAVPVDASAQAPRGDGWWEWALPSVAAGERIRTARGAVVLPWPGGDRDGRWDDRRRGDRGGRGPKFCRNGEGHPVHGRRWCAEKGFGRYDVWRRVGWGDIVFGDVGRREASLGRGTLIDILGDVVFGRLSEAGRRSGGGPLQGRWLRAGGYGGDVLQVRSGDRPLAELTDLDGDGRVDAVLLFGGS